MNILDDEIYQRINEKKFGCGVCEKTFSSKSCLNNHHKLVHDEPSPYKCKICLKVFSSKSKLVRHTRVHTGEKPFVCSTCGKGFATKYTLKNHKAYHNEERKYKCNICTEARFFKTKSDLFHHTQIHFERTHECQQCGNKFHLKRDLKRHEKIHLR